MKAKRILSVAVASLVFLPTYASADHYYGHSGLLGGLLNNNTLCTAAGVGTGLGVAGKHKAGWGVVAGAGAALLCKGITNAAGMGDPQAVGQPYYPPTQVMTPTPSPFYGQPPVQYQPMPSSVYGNQPPVYGQPSVYQPGTVMLPPASYAPGGYEMRQFRARNNTRGIIFVRTPQGLHRLEPGGEVQFFDNVSTGAGGAFYAVHAMAAIQVPGGYISQWAHAFTNNNGSLIWAAEFRDYAWGGKIVPAYAATRYEITPPDAVQGAPGVQAHPAPPQSSVPPQAGPDDERSRLLAEIETLKLRIKELEKKPADDPLE